MKRITKSTIILCLAIGLAIAFTNCGTTTTSQNSVSQSPNQARPTQTIQIPDIPVTSPELFEFTINGEGSDRTIMITGYKGIDEAVRIPDKINNIPVTLIADRSFMNKKNPHYYCTGRSYCHWDLCGFIISE